MKTLVAAVIGILAGFLLGGIGPRRDLAEAQSRIDDLKYQLTQADKRASSHPERFMPWLPSIDRGEARRLPPPSPGASGAPEASPAATPRLSPHEAFRVALDAQDVRRKQIVAALWEKDGHRQVGLAESVVDKMNKDLATHQDAIVKLLDADPSHPPDPAEFLGLTHDISGILLDAQTQYQTALGDGFSGLDPQVQQVWNQIDLAPFQDAFERAASRAEAAQAARQSQ